MRVIRWGMIGCGEVAEVKSGPGFEKANNSTLIAVMRRNSNLAKDYAVRHNVPKWYDDADELINDPEVDAVYIATPPVSHKEYTIRCAKAGKPVYVEKPMALSYNDCQLMIQECEKVNVPLYVAFYRRALPQFIKVKELIESGIIGDVRFVTVRHFEKPHQEEIEGKNLPWRVIPEISGGGKFLDMGCHTLDILDYILGPIKEAKGSIDNQAQLYKADDIVTGNFVFESGVQGIGVWCFSAFENYEMNEIIGSKGKIEFSTFSSEPVVLTTEEKITKFPIENPKHIQQPLIQTVVNELNGESKCPSSGKSAARTSWVIDQIVKNYYKK
ncbi:Predicted dehydrogenase [Natronincola peptidivorans]|uniref:Predicted dehydrogenase n=1 Tax=Natronincola peptidivorans TaxID=426128 RepID=A0A1I0E074_9FIRM|nr:Gfo/Idh/MocA family oxidoreductase [Natronincola peptidivorans]SET37985.1 Predicted dehydrogenase [Natronincola peptidivorans]